MTSQVLEARVGEIVRDAGAAEERVRLRRLFDLTWDWFMTQYPEWATRVGYPGQNDRWTDRSAEAIRARRDALALPLRGLASIDRAALAEADRLDADLFRRELEERVEEDRFPHELLAVNQLRGVQIDAARLLAAMPAQTVRQYEDILSRLRSLPRLVDQAIALLDQGLRSGVTPPRVTLRDVPAQVRGLLTDDPLRSPLLEPFARFPAAVEPADRDRLRDEASAAVKDRVFPALRRLLEYLEQTYLPAARETTAFTALPDGEAWYALRVRRATTTELSPREIHELGLREVRRIRGELDRVIAEARFDGSFEEFVRFLNTDTRFFFDRRVDLL
ncbi:MAG: DUF885 domain-containing protein, partial [Deferrisomatales bacterium]